MEEGGERLRSYLQDETEYTRQYLQDRLKGFNTFRQQIREASQPTHELSEIWWPYEYWAEPSQEDPGDQAFFRKNLEKSDAKPQLLVDTGTLEDDFGQTGVGGIKLSPCQQYMLMLSEFDKGSESYTIDILDLNNESVLEDDRVFPDVSGAEWSNNSQKIVYTTHDEQNRPHKVWVHVVGTSKSEDVCLMEEKDPKYYLHVGTTKNRKFSVITAASKMSSEVYLLDGKVESPYQLSLVHERRPGLEYFVECWKNDLIILANNTKSGNYTLNLCPTSSLPGHIWKKILPENEDFIIEDLEMTHQKCILLTRSFKGQSLKTINVDDENYQVMNVDVPDWVRQITLGTNLDFYSQNFIFFGSSTICKNQPFAYNFETEKCTMQPNKTDDCRKFDHDSYECTTELAKGEDGTIIPLTVAHSKSLQRNGQNPCLLEVYGAYGHALDMSFQPHRIPLLDQGWVIALGHVRGGGEKGRFWHKMGRLENKKNSITDSITIIQYLMSRGYTNSGQIALETFSAGGVIAGALLNNHANLFLAAILQVPFVDILTVLTDEKQPLTVHEYEEWGNPNEPADFKQIKELCPYQNIKENRFPDILVNCGYHDSRVPVWGPAKWIAKLKENQRGEAKILLHTDFDGGHFSSESERSTLRDLQYTFLIDLWNRHCDQKQKNDQNITTTSNREKQSLSTGDQSG